MFLIKFTLLVLACMDKSCLNQLFIWWSPNSDFSFHHFFYIYVLRCYCKEKLFLLPHLLFYLLVSEWVYRFLFYLIDYILSYHYFDAQLAPDLASGRSFTLVPVSYWHVPVIFQLFLTFCHENQFQTHCELSQPQPWNQPVLQGAPGPFTREWYL